MSCRKIGGVAASGFQNPTVITLTSGTSYTSPPNVDYLEVYAIGSGGGGGGANNLGVAGCGGGAGGVSFKFFPAGTYTYVIGVGGGGGTGLVFGGTSNIGGSGIIIVKYQYQ